MYFPILRGRQFELLALRECVRKDILSNQIIPIIEPVKASSTYVKTIDTFITLNKSIAVIINPQIGTFDKGLSKENNISIRQKVSEQLKNSNIIPSFYVTPKLGMDIDSAQQDGHPIDSLLLLCDNPDYLSIYEEVVGNDRPLYNVIPDQGDFRRRIRPNRIMCQDHFPKQMRNVDYLAKETEFFSSDHLYYQDDGYKGFSDYSIVGKEYTETGFAPYAVAIHIVYFDDKHILRIAHFVSDSNDDIYDPARKFAEAVEKLVKWNKTMRLNTIGIQEFENAYRNQIYPGLGVVKKYSIMHHLELMSKYLDGVEK
mgnify:CR=1 FL=1